MKITCSSCNSDYRPSSNELGNYYTCKKCQSLFFERKFIEHANKSNAEQLMALVGELFEGCDLDQAASKKRDFSFKRCPICNSLMSQKHEDSLELQLCVAHGVWAPMELIQVIFQQAIKSMQPRDVESEPFDLLVDDGLEDTGLLMRDQKQDVLSCAIGLLFAQLSYE